jgi:ATP-dependent Clp protease protease subunit
MDIYLYDVIGDDYFGDGAATAKGLRDELAKVEADEPIDLRINSPGGDVMQAVAMIELLAGHSGEVTAHIDGMAASAASFIAAWCPRVKMAKGGLYMIHDPWSVVVGGADAMRREAGVLDKVRENLAQQYAGRKACTLSLEEVLDLMAAETWYTAEEAKAAGFVDEISGGAAKAMAIPMKLGFKNAPKNLYGKQQATKPASHGGRSIAAWRQRIAATARKC